MDRRIGAMVVFLFMLGIGATLAYAAPQEEAVSERAGAYAASVSAQADAVAADPVTSTLQISFIPQYAEMHIGDMITVAVHISDAVDLYGIHLRIRFSPGILVVDDANEARSGIQITEGNLLLPPLLNVMNQADNGLGEIKYTVVLDRAPKGVTGSGTLAIITFEGAGLGKGRVSFVAVQPSNSKLQPITPIIGDDAEVAVKMAREVHLPLIARSYRRS